ncbi:hypothetical protein [Clostridium perfringens]|uniref:hypothetical protein n=1 Tax=Clostridium perfringens TaxID=1502 RepID=UPI0024BC76AF|nr:hypothetical protein [Clostridium perfringens]CAJ1760167.1 hypothetical protein AUSP0115_00023 [uncultured phage]
MKFIKTAWSMMEKPTKRLLLSGLIVVIGFLLAFINEWIYVICLCLALANVIHTSWKYMFKEEWEEFKLKVKDKIESDNIKQ